MAKPPQLPVWGTDVTNNLEPSAARKAAGWTGPGKRLVNWVLNTIYLWVFWLDALFDANGTLKRAVRIRKIPICSGLQISGTAVLRNPAHDSFATTAADLVYRIPIIVDEGERITLVRMDVDDAGSDVLTMTIWKDVVGFARVQLGATANSTGSTGAIETISSGAIAELVNTGFVSYYAELTCTYSSGGDFYGSLQVTTDVPGV